MFLHAQEALSALLEPETAGKGRDPPRSQLALGALTDEAFDAGGARLVQRVVQSLA